MSDLNDISPDLDELLQVDPAMTTVPVRVVDGAGVWQLPNRRVRTDEETITDQAWVQILDGSKKRSSAFLMASGNPIRIRTSTSGNGLLWPVGVPYPIRHTQSVYVIASVSPAVVGVSEEYWSD